MNTEQFWALIDEARRGARTAEEVAKRAEAILASRDVAEIVGFHRHVRRVLAASYTADLWAAAYLINGGCSDDGFEYFRGWLMTEGRAAFAGAVAEPDSLADLPAVRRAATTGEEFECEEMLGVGARAHMKATGTGLPADPVAVPRPEIELWDFDDEDAVRHRFPRLAALFQEPPDE